jgi:hypothetical protein
VSTAHIIDYDVLTKLDGDWLDGALRALCGPDKCKTDDCDNPAEHTSGYCAECHDRAGERQDERTAEERR